MDFSLARLRNLPGCDVIELLRGLGAGPVGPTIAAGQLTDQGCRLISDGPAIAGPLRVRTRRRVCDGRAQVTIPGARERRIRTLCRLDYFQCAPSGV